MGKAEIWAWWRGKSYSKKATAAIMGNIQAESVFLSNNVEDRCPLTDEEYTRRVDNGQISREWFIYDGPNNKDGLHYGYGYYQHTFWSRKAGLYDLCKKKDRSISDPECQHEWAETELHQGEYLRVLNKLKSDASLADMTREFMLYFEKPGDQSENAIAYRVRLAQAIYDEFAGEEKPNEYWPPRKLEKGMSGPDVAVMQSVLAARGYDVSIDGDFGSKTEEAVIAFKTSEGLTKSNVMGNKAWSRLLRR